jgi:hypothetical protein
VKALALILALLASTAPSSAQSPTGISGVVVNLDDGRPISGAQVQIYRLPLEQSVAAVATLQANARGFFTDIALSPGRYVVVATANGVRTGCEISELHDGVVERMRMEISAKGERCIGKNVRNSLVVPGQTSDVYTVH